jgi:uncharacterized protein (TIGR00288 family)
MPTSIRPGPRAESHVHAPNAALLIDFDNVTLGVRSEFTKELRTLLNSDIIRGKVAVQRAYADWRRYPQYIVPLSESSIDLIFAPAFGSVKKNATDIRLAIDAMELVFTRPEIGTFILLSGDSDFSMLVIKLKEYGKYVIGVGIRESASDILIQNCDEYYSYSDLAGLTKEADTPSTQRDPWELVKEAAAQMQRNGDVMRSDRLKQVMQQIDTNFDERNAGYNRFSKFVIEASNKGLIKVHKLDNGQFEVSPAQGAATAAATSSAAASPSAPAEPRNGEERDGGRRRGRRGRGGRGRDREEGREGKAADAGARETPAAAASAGLSLARAFGLMREALAQLPSPAAHEALRLRMSALHGRDDAMLTAERFPRLLRQANDAELADVRKVGEDDFEVTLHPTEDPRARSGMPARSAVPAPSGNGAGGAPEEAVTPAAPRFGVRSRPGARTLARVVPLVGAVSLDDEPLAQAASPSQAPSVTDDGVPPAGGKRPRRGAKAAAGNKPAAGNKAKAAASKPAAGAPTAPPSAAVPAAKPRRPRARAAKKSG